MTLRPATSTAVAAPPRARVVLVVEDEPVVREVERRALADAGCTVLEAVAGEQALELAAAHPGRIDVLVTDLTLPGLRGCELAGRLLLQRPGLGVIFTSGYGYDDELGRNYPRAVFLQKPFSLDELGAAVEAVAAP